MDRLLCRIPLLVLIVVFTVFASDGQLVRVSYGEDSVGVLEPAWNTTRGGPRADEGWAVAVDEAGNVYFAGFDRVARATADVFLSKLTPQGIEVWRASWGGAFDDEAFIVTVQAGFVYVGGRTFSSFSLASADMMILKFHSSNGSLVWSRTWDGGAGYDEVDGLVADGNNLYVAGWVMGRTTQLDIVVLKYSTNGTLLWGRSWGTADVDEANGQISVDENFIYVVGRYRASPLGLGGDAVLVAFNKTDGNYAWHKTWGGSGLDDAFGMTMDEMFIYSVGITNSFGGDAIFLLKYDKKGSLLWNVTWGGKGSELARSLDVSSDSKYVYIAGSTTSFGSGDFDVLLLGYDQNGSLFLSKTWGGHSLDQSHGMTVHGASVYIAGETRSFGAGAEDAFLLKVDIGQDVPAYFRTYSLAIRPASVDVGATVAVSVEVANVGGRSGAYNVTLKVNDRVEEIRTISLGPGKNQTVTFSVSTPQQGTFSVNVNGLSGSYTVRRRGCIIATATYGSVLSPEVQFLRHFRDNIVLNTFAGRNFMTVFDAWYYSFSPGVASLIEGESNLRQSMKIILYPLIGILHVAVVAVYPVGFNPELAVVLSGLVASSLISIVYFTPFVLLPCLIRKVIIPSRVLRILLLVWILSLGSITIAMVIESSGMMMVSTATLILTTISLVALAVARYITEIVRAKHSSFENTKI